MAGYFLLGWLGVWLGGILPDRWEKRLAGSHEAHAGEVATDHRQAFAKAEEILAKLLKQESATLRDLDYRLFFLDFDVPNAVATPGGGIGVTPALLEMVTSELGLAMVLAHELGHHQERHIPKRLGRTLTVSLAASLVTGGDQFSPIDAAVCTAESGFSRSQEEEADRFGLQLIHLTYGTTEGALEFFEGIRDWPDNPERPWHRYTGSHPLTEDRLEKLRQWQAQLERGESIL